MKAKPAKPATKQKQSALALKDLKPKKNPKGGLIRTDGDPEEDPLIP